MSVSTHILDTTRGRPAAGVSVTLERETPAGFVAIGGGLTDADGRIKALIAPTETPEAGVHRLHFAVGEYFARLGVEAFYPAVSITFTVRAPAEHHHVPLLLNPFGYSTYRGS